MARTYSVALTGTSISAAGEIVAITAAAGKPFYVVRIVVKVSQNALPIAQNLDFAGKIFTSVTGGTGGTAVTPQQHLLGDAASSATALRQNSTANTGTVGGTPYQDACYSNQGIDTLADLGDGFCVLGSDIFVLALVNATASSVAVALDGRIEIVERF